MSPTIRLLGILSPLVNSSSQLSQEICQEQPPANLPATGSMDRPVNEDKTLIPHPLVNEGLRQPENSQDHILDISKFPDYAYSIPTGRARSGWIVFGGLQYQDIKINGSCR